MKNYDFLKKISILVFAFREKREMSEFVRSRARSDVGISVSCQQTRLFGWGNSLGNHLEIVLYVFRFCRNVNFRLRNQRWEIRFFFFVHPLLVCAFHLPRFRFLFLLRWKWMNITLSTIAEHFFLFFFFQFRSRPLSRKSCGLLSMIDTFQKKKVFYFLESIYVSLLFCVVGRVEKTMSSALKCDELTNGNSFIIIFCLHWQVY